jgi:hypothetical protein
VDVAGVGADGEGIDIDRAPLVFELGGHVGLRQGRTKGGKGLGHGLALHQLDIPQAASRRDKVFDVAGNVEAAQVAAEQAIHNRFPPVQNIEHIRRREGGVVEEGDLHIGHFLPNVVGRQPQVVVVNPDQSVIGCFLGGSFGKQLINVLKVLPI